METLSQNFVKIRKARSCHGCADKFPIGTKMMRVVNIDGHIFSSYWCECCNAYWIQHCQDEMDGLTFGAFRGEPHYNEFKESFLATKKQREV